MGKAAYEYQGVAGLKAIAAHVGMPFGVLNHRIYVLKLPIEEAVKNPHKPDKKRYAYAYEYQGVKGMAAISKLVGIPARRLSSRVKNGYTLEEAIAQGVKAPYPECSERVQKKRKVEVVGVRWPDLLSDHWKLALGMRVSQ